MSHGKISVFFEMTEKTGHTLCYDGDCPFCRSMVNRWRGTLERRGFEIVPLQTEWVRRRLDLPEEELLSELRVLTPDGRVLGGAAGLVHVWGKIWWAWPLWLLAWVPGVRWLLDRAYRWMAERRMCFSDACSLQARPEPKRGLAVLGWLPLLVLPVLVVIFQNVFPAKWIFMWALAVAIFISCKWLTWVRALAVGGIGGIGRALGYLFAWVGMDARPFMGEGEPAVKPARREWLAAVFKVLLGAGMIWGLVRLVGIENPIAAGWCGMIGLMFLLHFGVFHLLALAWRGYGVATEPIMRTPAAATSLSAFWGERWNRGFNQLVHELIFRKTFRRLGVAWAMLLVFLASGLIHDLVISVPAGAWFGLPTAYFVLQGIGVLTERSRWGRHLGLGRGALGWVFMFVFTAGPAYWLFHPPFIEEVFIPFLKVIRAL
jgi:alginate O-acetyltransferase complex protein AlgI